MADSPFNVEGATNGLVLALFLVAALFLAVMLFYILRDMDTRTQAAEPASTAVSVPVRGIAGPSSAGPPAALRPPSA